MAYSAEPVVYDHTLIIGDTYRGPTVSLVDATGAAYDLTGATGECEVVTESGGETLLTPTVTVSGTTDDFYWSSAYSATASLQPQRARYAVRITFADGTRHTVIRGTVTILAAELS